VTAQLSDIIVPVAGIQYVQPSEILHSSLPSLIGLFGTAVSISSDGLSLAVGEAGGNTTAAMDIGTVQLFTRTNIDSTWVAGPLLISSSPGASQRFGFDVKFSPDGVTLAVAEIHAGAGTALDSGKVHLFARSGTSWSNTPITGPEIISGAPEADDIFGSSLAFSPSGNTLAIGAPVVEFYFEIDSGGSVQLFNKSGASWLDSPIIAGPTLVSDLRFHDNAFGNAIVFSPDGETIAVGEHYGSMTLNGSRDGKVQLFNKTDGDWINEPSIGPVLVSQDPGGLFGTSIDFSADSKTLAVGEYFGHMPDQLKTSVGNVQLFNRDGSTWNMMPTYGQVITSRSPSEYNAFGSELKFSPDGTKLISGELRGDPEGYSEDSGLIEVFSRTDINWLETPSRDIILISNLPSFDGFFGGEIEISHDGSTLIVGNSTNEVNALKYAGAVKLFDTSIIN